MTARQQTELLQQHPLSAAFPSMPEQELQALAIDIEKNGQREPGVMYEGKVLDGWHRYLACQAANVEFRTVAFDGADPKAFVLSVNDKRRHSTPSQRAASVVKVSEWRPAGRPEKGEPGSPFSTNAEMAKAADVSARTIQQAKAAEEAGLGDAVRDGAISAKTGAELAKLPPGKRAKAVKAIKEGKPALPKEKKPSGDVAKLQARITELEEQLAGAKESLSELADTAASVEAFKNDEQFKEMQVLRAELRSAKRRRDELMRENAEQKKLIAYWKKRAGAK